MQKIIWQNCWCRYKDNFYMRGSCFANAAYDVAVKSIELFGDMSLKERKEFPYVIFYTSYLRKSGFSYKVIYRKNWNDVNAEKNVFSTVEEAEKCFVSYYEKLKERDKQYAVWMHTDGQEVLLRQRYSNVRFGDILNYWDFLIGSGKKVSNLYTEYFVAANDTDELFITALDRKRVIFIRKTNHREIERIVAHDNLEYIDILEAFVSELSVMKAAG